MRCGAQPAFRSIWIWRDRCFVQTSGLAFPWVSMPARSIAPIGRVKSLLHGWRRRTAPRHQHDHRRHHAHGEPERAVAERDGHARQRGGAGHRQKDPAQAATTFRRFGDLSMRATLFVVASCDPSVRSLSSATAAPDRETDVNRVRRARHGTKVGPVGAHPQGLQEGALLERRLAQFWMTGSTIHDRPRRTSIVLEVERQQSRRGETQHRRTN